MPQRRFASHDGLTQPRAAVPHDDLKAFAVRHARREDREPCIAPFGLRSRSTMSFVSILATSKPVARLSVLQAPSLKKIPWLVHGFSTRSGGFTTAYGGRTLNLGFTKDDTRENVERNRAKLLLSLGAGDKRNPWPLVSLRQIHSDLIHVIRSAEPSRLTG